MIGPPETIEVVGIVPDTFIPTLRVTCRADPTQRETLYVRGTYNGRDVVRHFCNGRSCKHAYHADGTSERVRTFHIIDWESGEILASETEVKLPRINVT